MKTWMKSLSVFKTIPFKKANFIIDERSIELNLLVWMLAQKGL
tara:strand:- start:30 stop:158 length:129 start_codon:yes stop_codon:yes gene_type:complete